MVLCCAKLIDALNTKIVVHVEVCDCVAAPTCSVPPKLPRALSGRVGAVLLLLPLSCLPLFYMALWPTAWLPSISMASIKEFARLPASFASSGPSREPACPAFSPPRWHTNNRLRFEPMWNSQPNNSHCPGRDPTAPRECACGILPGTVLIRSSAGGGFLTAFPGGGEVFAIGKISKTPLQRVIFRLSRAEQPPWVRLTHVYSDNMLMMLPPNAKEGSWMLMAGGSPTSRADHFCLQPSSVKSMGGTLYSLSSKGVVNGREGFSKALVLLRGHGNAGPRPAATSLPTAQVQIEGHLAYSS